MKAQIKIAALAATMALSVPATTVSAATATYKVSADVVEQCTLTVRSAHLGSIKKDKEAAVDAVQSATAKNVKISCGGLTLDLGALLSNPLTAVANVNGLIADLQATLAAIGAGYDLTFDSANSGKFISTAAGNTDEFAYEMFVLNSANILDPAAVTALLSDAPSAFADGDCASRNASYAAVTFGNTVTSAGGLPITTSGTLTQALTDAGAPAALLTPISGVTDAIPSTFETGANVVDLCYQVKTRDVDDITVTDQRPAGYTNDFQADDGGTPGGVYQDTITVTLDL